MLVDRAYMQKNTYNMAGIIRTFTAFGLLMASGCTTEQFFTTDRSVRGPVEITSEISEETTRILPMFTGQSGKPMGWSDLINAIAWADIIVVGEQHDDAVGHAVQRSIVEDTCRIHYRAALSMEMLERDEQNIVQDYLEDIISAKTLAKLTHSENWGGEGGWAKWYQPIVDAAKDAGGQVIAANAPRRYVKLARKKGYAVVNTLPTERRRLVDCPGQIIEGDYQDRFLDTMRQMHEEATAAAAEAAAEKPEEPVTPETAETRPEAAPPAEHKMPEKVADDEAASETKETTEEAPPKMPPPFLMAMPTPEELYLSQLVWDTTMAKSIANARSRGAKKVVHLVGQFHCDFNGGTVQQIRKFRPRDRVLVISMQRANPTSLLEEDQGRADIVIYTGERPPEPEEEKSETEVEDEKPESDTEAVAETE